MPVEVLGATSVGGEMYIPSCGRCKRLERVKILSQFETNQVC